MLNAQYYPVVELPDVSRGLSEEATEYMYHDRARNAVAGIYLKSNGEMMKYQPTFRYLKDYVLFLFSMGPLMSNNEVSASMRAFGRFYQNQIR